MSNFANNIALFVGSLFVAANDEARRIRNAFVTSIIGVALVYITQLIFNNLTSTMIIAIICDVIIMWAWFNVRRLVFVAGFGETAEVLGITTHPGSNEAIGRTEVPKLNILFDLYIATALYAVFWMHVMCFFAPLLSLSEYPWFGVFLLFGGTAYLIMYPKGALLRKTLVWGIVIALILMFLRLISPAAYIKSIGFDPFWAMRVTAADRALADVLAAQEESEDSRNVTRFKGIQQKIERGETLTSEEKKFLNEKSQGLFQKTFRRAFSSSAEAKTAPAPQATATKKKKHAVNYPLDFFAGEKVLRQGKIVEVYNGGGYAVFRYSDLPQRPDITYYVVFSIICKTNGKYHLEVNGGQGGTLFLDHYASERVETCVFKFDPSIQSQFFHPGDNRFKISSPGSDIEIQDAFVQVECWE